MQDDYAEQKSRIIVPFPGAAQVNDQAGRNRSERRSREIFNQQNQRLTKEAVMKRAEELHRENFALKRIAEGLGRGLDELCTALAEMDETALSPRVAHGAKKGREFLTALVTPNTPVPDMAPPAAEPEGSEVAGS